MAEENERTVATTTNAVDELLDEMQQKQGETFEEAANGDLAYRLVEIFGMSEPLQPTPSMLETNPDAEPSVVDGEAGWVVGWSEEEQRYLVQTLGGEYVSIQRQNLRHHEPLTIEEGGFDVAWPPEGFPMDGFADRVARELLSKNFCVIQLSEGEEQRKRALAKARQHHDWAAVIPEFEFKFMGRGARGKISFLDGDPEEGELTVIDRRLSYLADLIGMYSPSLGFIAGERSKALLRVPFDDPSEEKAMARGGREDDLASAADIEHLLDFAKRARICMLHVVSSRGGTIMLDATDPELASIELPFKEGRLLLINDDLLKYSLHPAFGAHLVVQAWIYREKLPGECAEASDEALALQAFNPLSVPRVPTYGDTGETCDAVSMSTVLPGEMEGPEQVWSCLACGVDGLIPVPSSRWDEDVYWGGPNAKPENLQMYARHFGILPYEYEYFDNEFFGISLDHAKLMEPHARKLMEVSYDCFMRGGWTMKTIENTNMAIAIGFGGDDWATMQEEGNWHNSPQDSDAIYYHQCGLMSNRIAYHFKLRGPAQNADTACSSSLSATALMHSHMRPLNPGQMRTGFGTYRCLSGLNLGVSCHYTAWYSIALCGSGMLSHNGRCFTFDSSADGFARSEGVSGIFFQVRQNEDFTSLSALAATNMNQDGRSASLTAPNGPSQQECIRHCIREARISPADVQVSELHGTGTALGDPIEVGALRATLMMVDGKKREHPLVKTSSKSNLAHMETNAGITGLMKCILMAMWSVACPGVHLRLLNPHIDSNGYPVLFNPEFVDQGKPSGFAGVSSFGFSGCNARGEVWGRASVGPRNTLPMIGWDLTSQRLQRFNNFTSHDSAGKYGTLHPDNGVQTLQEGWNGFFQIGNPDMSGAPTFFLSGTWNSWRTMDEMHKTEGKWQWAFRMGDTLCEEFRIHVDYFIDHIIFPARKRAGKDAQIFGPGSAPKGHTWRVDGRKDGAKPGTLYKVSFWWDEAAREKRIDWEMGGDDLEALVGSQIPRHTHKYSVKASWTSWSAQDLKTVAGLPYMYETTVTIGASGREEFYFLRDRDECQLIYPAVTTERRTNLPVRGPDDNAQGRCWVIQGDCGERITIRLRVREGNIVLTLISSSRGERTWRNPKSSDVDELYSLRIWQKHELVKLEHTSDGKHRGIVTMPVSSDPLFFHVLLDESANQIIYPEMHGASSGLSAWLGPDDLGQGMYWQVNEPSGCDVEVMVDMQQPDRRQAITWRPLVKPVSDGQM